VTKINFVADFFLNSCTRGAEQNDAVILEYLEEWGYEVTKIRSYHLHLVDPKQFYIVSNFAMLPEHTKRMFEVHKNYIIYEHDFKMHPRRNPGEHKDCEIPGDVRINQNFYRKASRTVCLTKEHARLVALNTPMYNKFKHRFLCLERS